MTEFTTIAAAELVVIIAIFVAAALLTKAGVITMAVLEFFS